MSLTVRVLPSEHQFEVGSGETVLAAAIRQGVGLPYGCQDGACGSCKCRWISGEFELGVHQLKALSEAERAAGFILACRTTPKTDLVIESHELPAAGMFAVKKMPCRVISIVRPTPDVAIIHLQLPANDRLDYHAGQYVQLILRDGTRRSYSMANAHGADDKQIELHVRHMPGGKFTDHVFGAMKDRDILRLEGPFGSFYLREDSKKPLVLLASGTGLAPIKAIIESMQAQGNTRPAVLYWGCRSKADLYLHGWAQAQAAALPWLDYVPVLSEPKDDDAWSGRTGFVHHAVMRDIPDLSTHEVYACGAPVMVDAAKADFTTQCHLPEDAFYADAFTTEADKAGPAA
ncbi:CDP-6-deoxy-delta-3,4-glucoseen reductase [Thiomonas sp. FB-Cd]|uniref:CDP-6-deoxy-delta-3,4-glucoseen reductase n=1 Tax=Thiomonas sp. FB-Cd TaxID=1158292 RepID=UPI0004DFB5D2|nr:CDP-6-deoxy-delta-3,4-glucoseen reductase [Thiomonas sp. FB-Cd]